jgi:hypothetical protein
MAAVIFAEILEHLQKFYVAHCRKPKPTKYSLLLAFSRMHCVCVCVCVCACVCVCVCVCGLYTKVFYVFVICQE